MRPPGLPGGGRRTSALALCALWLLAGAADAARNLPDDLPLEVTAAAIAYDEPRALYVAEGEVRIVQGERSLDADLVMFSTRTRRGVASGNVIVTGRGQVVAGSFLEFDVDTLEGIMFKGNLDAGPGSFRVSAGVLEKTGEDIYAVEDGSFTTCRCRPGEEEPWRIEASEAEVELGGYGKAKNSRVDVLGIPVLWLPWVMFPVKTERESGLLFPVFAFGSNNGVEIGVPIFWAARDELNVILTPKWLSKRGFKPELEFEYVFGERSGGSLFGSFIHDKDVESGAKVIVDGTLVDFDNPVPKNRWAVIWEHDQDLPGDWTFRTDAKFASDNLYAFDFDELEPYRRDRFLEAVGFAFNQYGGAGQLGLVGSALYGNDVQNPDSRFAFDPDPFPTDFDEFILQRLPALSAEVLPSSFGAALGLVGDLDLDFVRFDAEKNPKLRPKLVPPAGAIATLRPDNEGNRFVVYPRLARPFLFADFLELNPQIGYQETVYQTTDQGWQERGIATARVDLRTRVRGEAKLPLLGRTRHVMVPSLGYTLLYPRNQNDDPVFVPPQPVTPWRLRQLSVQDAVRDPWDRVDRINAITFGVENRFYGAALGGARGDLMADLNFSGHYDIRRSQFGWLVLDGQIYGRRGVTTRFGITVDPKKAQIDEGLMDVSVALPRFWRSRALVGSRYRWRRQLPLFIDAPGASEHINQLDAYIRLGIGQRWLLHYAMQYSFQDSELLSNRGGIEFRSKCKCWAIGVDIQDDPVRGVQVGFRYSILGIGDDGLRGNPMLGTGALR